MTTRSHIPFFHSSNPLWSLIIVFLGFVHGRSFGEDFNLTDHMVKQPALLIMGSKDYVYKFPGIGDYIDSGKVKEFVPNLDVIFLPEGTHFVQEQSPEEANQLILNFLSKHI